MPDSEKNITGPPPVLPEMMRAAEADYRTCMSRWFPAIEAAGLPVPKTVLVRADEFIAEPRGLNRLLDGESPEGFDRFIARLQDAVDVVGGKPVFLRTGLGSGKHDWMDTCFVDVNHQIASHVAALVEWSAIVDMMGLSVDVWAVRAMIPTKPLFYAFAEMPITREFRVFIDGDEIKHVQPYWPPKSIERPDVEDWADRLAVASKLTPEEGEELCFMAGMAAGVLDGGYWSIDFLQDRDGKWWLTDMADGFASFRWDPEA